MTEECRTQHLLVHLFELYIFAILFQNSNEKFCFIPSNCASTDTTNDLINCHQFRFTCYIRIYFCNLFCAVQGFITIFSLAFVLVGDKFLSFFFLHHKICTWLENLLCGRLVTWHDRSCGNWLDGKSSLIWWASNRASCKLLAIFPLVSIVSLKIMVNY